MRLDPTRLQVLRQLLILDSLPENRYDDLVRLLAEGLAVPITLVNLLDADRDWFKATLGMPTRESAAATSFCEAFFHTADDIIVVEDTLLDARFAEHPLVVGGPHIRFYGAARLTVRGQTVGTLCAPTTRSPGACRQVNSTSCVRSPEPRWNC